MARQGKAGRGAGEVRIIGGEWRRRRIRFPTDLAIRPTPDRLRETLFNWLGDWIVGRRVLDLFAGSGALGIEALSRGAREVVFVERDRRIAQALSVNLQALNAGHFAHIENEDAQVWLQNARAGFDLVLLDPPYAWKAGPRLLKQLAGNSSPLLRVDHRVYLERVRSRSTQSLPDDWTVIRTSHAGDAQGLLVRHMELSSLD